MNNEKEIGSKQASSFGSRVLVSGTSVLWRDRKKAGCFNAYYDTPVLTRSALSAFTEQAEQKEPGEQADVLPQTTGWSMEEMQSVSSEVREAVTADVWKIAGSMESFFAGQLAGGSYPWEDDVQGCMVSTALAENYLEQKTYRETGSRSREWSITFEDV